MPQYNRNDLEIAARNQHFTRDTFEKVLRLKTILDWMNAHEFLRAHLLLKGGTAINLTIFELPRLSVDIDMDFVPNLPREDMLQTSELPKSLIPDGAVTDTKMAVNLPAAIPIQKGDVLTTKKFYSDVRMAGFPGKIPDDCRAGEYKSVVFSLNSLVIRSNRLQAGICCSR